MTGQRCGDELGLKQDGLSGSAAMTGVIAAVLHITKWVTSRVVAAGARADGLHDSKEAADRSDRRRVRSRCYRWCCRTANMCRTARLSGGARAGFRWQCRAAHPRPLGQYAAVVAAGRAVARHAGAHRCGGQSGDSWLGPGAGAGLCRRQRAVVRPVRGALSGQRAARHGAAGNAVVGAELGALRRDRASGARCDHGVLARPPWRRQRACRFPCR